MSKAIQYLHNLNRTARVATRWWWYGCAVDTAEIDRELCAMADAGMGMAEIQIIYPLQADDENASHVDYFSPRFFELIDFTIGRAKAYGIDIDFTLGSGWPFGGSFVTDTMAPAILVPYQHDVMGPVTFSFDYTCVLNGEIERAVLCPIANGVMDWRNARDITDHIKPTYIYSWVWGQQVAEVSIPEGPHKIYTFVVQKYKQNIGKPSPNMQGLALDHCRRETVDEYLETLGRTLLDKIGAHRIRSFFCDSIELSGNNWSPNLLEEFKRRRGYDLTPYLPALWGDMGDVTPYVRGDYFETFGELTQEYFFENFADWCRSHGVLSRIQAHGTWADILKAYAAADIPEGETFGEHDRYYVNTIHRRLAVSAGILYGRPIISNESFTWLRMPRYLVTPEMIKRAADAILIDGVNAIVNHGFSYSPEHAGKPGWTFYASSMISPNNTWWEYYPPVSHYIHRICSLMQEGDIVSPVAVYLPQSDVRAQSPMAELHMALQLEKRMGSEAINHLQRCGYWITFINDEKLLDLDSARFSALILLGANRISLETAKAFHRLDHAGLPIIAVRALPDDTCGLVDHQQRREQVRALLSSLRHAHIVPDAMNGLIATLQTVCNPDLLIEGEAAQDVGFIHRRIHGQDVYFVANIAAKARTCTLSIPGLDPVRILDAMTLQDIAPLGIAQFAQRTQLTLKMHENQSFIFLVNEEGLAVQTIIAEPPRIDLCDWSLEIQGKEIARDLVHPIGWEQFETSRYYSGEGTYQTIFDWHGGQATLVLEEVNCCCHVELNGKEQGRLWMSPYRLSLIDLQIGINTLRIHVVNTWFNHFKNPEYKAIQSQQAVGESWPYFNAIIDDIRYRRLDAVKEQQLPLQPSGLARSVYLLVE